MSQKLINTLWFPRAKADPSRTIIFIYYRYTCNLYEPPKQDCLDLWILEMEDWMMVMMDEGDGGITQT